MKYNNYKKKIYINNYIIMSDISIVKYNNNYLMFNNYPILYSNNKYYYIDLDELNQNFQSNNYIKYININNNNTKIDKIVISELYQITLSVINITDEPNNIFCNNKLKEMNIDIDKYNDNLKGNVLLFYNSLDNEKKKLYIISYYILNISYYILKNDSKQDNKISIDELIKYKKYFLTIDNKIECNNNNNNNNNKNIQQITGIIIIIVFLFIIALQLKIMKKKKISFKKINKILFLIYVVFIIVGIILLIV